MGRKRLTELVREVLEESSNGLKDFSVKVVSDNGKFWIGYVKAKNEESAIKEMKVDIGAKAKNYSYEIV